MKFDGFKRNATLDLYTSEHKTSTAGLRRELYMPLVIPTEGICEGDWVGTFLRLGSELGFDWERVPLGPLLPAPRLDGGWLRRLLHGCSNSERVRAHSMKVTLCVWAARACFSKERRATLSHHASALHGSDIVYSRELQSGAIRKLQRLLKKIRMGLGQEGAPDEATRDVVSTFDSGHTSAVRTPLPLQQHGAPATPPLEKEGVATLALQDVKTENEVEQECQQELAADQLFSFEDLKNGLIELDSSSGSSSSSSDSESVESEVSVAAAPKHVPAAYTETVPEGFVYSFRRKSKIMHRRPEGKSSFTCGIESNQNFSVLPHTFHFKYPKCLKCFHDNHNRICSREEAIQRIDGIMKRQKLGSE